MKRCTHSRNNTKGVLKSKKRQLLLIFYCSCRTVCQYEREDPVVECMRCYEWFHQKCEKIPRKVFTNKAAKDLASYIASDLLEHSQVKWSVNFYHLLVKYITKLYPVYFQFTLLVFKSIFVILVKKKVAVKP